MGLRLPWVAVAAMLGGIATAATAARFADGHGRIVDVLASSPISVAGGAIGGVLCALTIWVLCSPRRRASRITGILVALNGAAWLIFLTANPRISDGGAAIVEQRASLDGQTRTAPQRMLFTEEPVFLVAGRAVNWIELSQKPLGFFAGLAIVFVHEQVVPERYWRIGPTMTESRWIAGAAFVLSMAWWVSAGTLASTAQVFARRREPRSSTAQS